jgi:hypothetical protein
MTNMKPLVIGMSHTNTKPLVIGLVVRIVEHCLQKAGSGTSKNLLRAGHIDQEEAGSWWSWRYSSWTKLVMI